MEWHHQNGSVGDSGPHLCTKATKTSGKLAEVTSAEFWNCAEHLEPPGTAFWRKMMSHCPKRCRGSRNCQQDISHSPDQWRPGKQQTRLPVQAEHSLLSHLQAPCKDEMEARAELLMGWLSSEVCRKSKEIMKIRAEINKTENRKTTKRINKT